jgi:hypothetical protein
MLFMEKINHILGLDRLVSFQYSITPILQFYQYSTTPLLHFFKEVL